MGDFMKNVFIFFVSALSLTVATCVLVMNIADAAPIDSGKPAPDFTLKTPEGKAVKLSDFKGKQIVVLEWFNKDCPFVHKFYDSKTMQTLQKKSVGPDVAWLTIVSSAPGKEGHLTSEEAKKVVGPKGLNLASSAFLIDSDGQVARMYGAKTTPHMFVINKNGVLAYQGAIDDKPSASVKSLEGAQNYVTEAIAALKSNQAVKNAATPPYGCSVKL